MPSVDVVSKVDMQALDNAINNVKREIASRFDFKNVTTEISFDRKTGSIHIVTGDDMKAKAVTEMIVNQSIRFKIDPKCFDSKEIEETSHDSVKRDIVIKEGVPREIAQKMVKLVKTSKLKVQGAIQEDKVRLTGKNIDDLQSLMQEFREQDYDIPLQFENMKS